MPLMRRHFRRLRHSKTIEAALEPAEALAVAGMCRQLSELLDDAVDPAGDAVLDRLFPRAYLDPTEEKAEEEWQRFAHDDLVAARHTALATVIRTLDVERDATPAGSHLEISLTEEEAEAWLSVLNDARLALGTRLEVTEELDFSGIDPDDPDSAPYAVYWWLGLLEEELVDALSGG